MIIKIQFNNDKVIIFEEAIIDNVRRLKVISSDYPNILDYYAGYLGDFMYFESPSSCNYLDGKSYAEIISNTQNKVITIYHKSGRNALIRQRIKHLWIKKLFFWKQIY